MSLNKGPYSVIWGDNTIRDVETIDFGIDIETEDYNTVQGNSYEVEGATKVGATITLLSTDIPSLSLILPQYWVPNGGQMSTGETVNNAEGAMDFARGGCDDAIIYDPFDIISCGNPATVTRMVNARTRLENIEFEGLLQKVLVRVIGEPSTGDGYVQIFKQNTINTVS